MASNRRRARPPPEDSSSSSSSSDSSEYDVNNSRLQHILRRQDNLLHELEMKQFSDDVNENARNKSRIKGKSSPRKNKPRKPSVRKRKNKPKKSSARKRK